MTLKAAELSEHPAYQNLQWKLPPTQSDYCTIAGDRSGGPFRLWYEVHGKGPRRMVVSLSQPQNSALLPELVYERAISCRKAYELRRLLHSG